MSIPKNIPLTQSPAGPPSRDRKAWGGAILLERRTLPLLALAVLVLVLFRDALSYAFLQGRINPSQSHATAVPFVSFLMAWMRREEIIAAVGRPHWMGWPLLAIAFLGHGLGVLGEEARLSLLALIMALFGLVCLVGGLRLAKLLAVPVLFLLFLVPYGHLEEKMSFFLRLLATRSGTFLASLAGVQAQVRGTVVAVSGSQLEIASPCSGLRSLSTLLALAVFFAYFAEPSVLGKIALILAAIPLAVAGNAVRLGLVLSAVESFGQRFGMKVHDSSGFIVFGFALAGLFGLERVFEWTRQKRRDGVSAS